MKFLRSVAGYTKLDGKRNDNVRLELAVRLVNDMMREYRQKWIDHVQRMERSRIPYVNAEYMFKGRRSLGRQMKRWRDQL